MRPRVSRSTRSSRPLDRRAPRRPCTRRRARRSTRCRSTTRTRRTASNRARVTPRPSGHTPRHADRRHRCDRERRDERARGAAADDRVHSILGVARRLPDVRGPKTAFARADIAGRPRAAPARRRLRGPSRLADPALADRHALTDERRRVRAGLRCRGRGRRAEPRLRVVDRRLLAGAEGPGRRDVAARRCPDELVRAPEGGGRAGARRFEREQPGVRVVRLPAGADDETRGGRGGAAPVLRAAAAEPAAAGRTGCASCRTFPAPSPRSCMPTTSVRPTAWRPPATCTGRFNVAADPELDGSRLAAMLGRADRHDPGADARAAAASSRLACTAAADLARLARPGLRSAAARLRPRTAELGWEPRHDAEGRCASCWAASRRVPRGDAAAAARRSAWRSSRRASAAGSCDRGRPGSAAYCRDERAAPDRRPAADGRGLRPAAGRGGVRLVRRPRARARDVAAELRAELRSLRAERAAAFAAAARPRLARRARRRRHRPRGLARLGGRSRPAAAATAVRGAAARARGAVPAARRPLRRSRGSRARVDRGRDGRGVGARRARRVGRRGAARALASGRDPAAARDAGRRGDRPLERPRRRGDGRGEAGRLRVADGRDEAPRRPRSRRSPEPKPAADPEDTAETDEPVEEPTSPWRSRRSRRAAASSAAAGPSSPRPPTPGRPVLERHQSPR